MPTVTSSSSNKLNALDHQRAQRIFFNYNFPAFAWVSFAILEAAWRPIWLPHLSHLSPGRYLAICPGCGLTTDLIHLLRGETPCGYFIYFVILGFSLNFFASLRRARSALLNEPIFPKSS